MKKSFVALFLVCALVFSALSLVSCSKNEYEKLLNPKEPVYLELWHYYNGPQKILFDELIIDFNETVGAEKGIVMEAFSQGSVNDMLNAVVAAANKEVRAEDIPDIFAAYSDIAYEVDQLGLVASLDEYFTEEELEEYIPSYIEEGRFDGEGSLKIFPIAKSTEIYTMNKTDWDVFAKDTGAKYEDLETLEGLVKTAEEYYQWSDDQTEAPNDGRALYGRDAIANYIVCGMMQLGHEVVSSDGDGNVVFDIDAEAMRKIWDNYYVPYINGYFGAFGKFRSDDVKTGDLLAYTGSTAGALYFPTEVMENDVESHPIESLVLETPWFEGYPRISVQQGAGMVVTKTEPAVEYACTVFLKWFTESQRNLNFSLESGYLPVKKEANDKALVEEYFKDKEDDPSAQALRDTLLVAIDEVNNDTLFTSKAVKNGNAVRNLLENALVDKSQQDREAVLELMGEGSSRQDAVIKFDTDENFESWLAEVNAGLQATQKG